MIPKPPPDLSPASQAAWPGLASDVAAVTRGAAVDFDLLADLLRARDRLATVSATLEADGVTVTGSMGQVRPHPLLSVEANLRKECADGLDRLGLTPNKRSAYVRIDRAGRIRED